MEKIKKIEPETETKLKRESAEKLNIQSVDRYLVSTLLNLSIPAKNKGFFFAKECAKEVYFNPISRFQMNELVFKPLADEYGTTISKIERSIRHALSIATSQKSMAKLSVILHTTENFAVLHPSVCEFLCLLAESISFVC